MECIIDKELRRLKKLNQIKKFKIRVIRRYIRIKLNIDIEINGLNRRIERLSLT